MSQGKKSFFSAEARSSGDLRGKQRVDQAAQLIGLMTDDALMTAACDLPLCVPGLYVMWRPQTTKAKLQVLVSEQIGTLTLAH